MLEAVASACADAYFTDTDNSHDYKNYKMSCKLHLAELPHNKIRNKVMSNAVNRIGDS